MKHEHALAALLARKDDISRSAPSGMPRAGSQLSYVNELGSVAVFNFNADQTVTGTYTSAVSSGGGSITGPITGWYNGFVLAWSVNWPTKPPAITSWVGEFITASGGYNIDTMWYLMTQTSNPGDPSEFWSAVNAGSDLFTPK